MHGAIVSRACVKKHLQSREGAREILIVKEYIDAEGRAREKSTFLDLETNTPFRARIVYICK